MTDIIKAFLTVSLALGLLVSCAQPNPHPMDMTSAVRTARTPADHEGLAEHYAQAAKDAETKVAEHRKLLDQYKTQSYLYGKQASSFQSHCEALIRAYQQVARENGEMAQMHRQRALESR